MSELTNVSVIPTTSLLFASAEYSEIIEKAPESYFINLCQVSATALLLWDMIITYNQEIELIWRSRRSIVNYLFFMIRYLSLTLSVLLVVASQGRFPKKNLCHVIYVSFFSMGSVVLTSTLDVLLVYRIFAFYERNRKVLVGLITLWLLNTAAFLILAIFYSKEVRVTQTPTVIKQGVTGECTTLYIPAFSRNIWVSELVFHGVLLTLVIARSINLLKTACWKTSAIPCVYYIFIRDGFCVFVHLFIVFIVSALRLNIVSDIAITQVGIVLFGITGSRLVLNLRNLKNASNHCDASHYTYWIGKKILFDTISETLVEEPELDESGMDSFELTPLSPTSALDMD